jgi:protein TonB
MSEQHIFNMEDANDGGKRKNAIILAPPAGDSQQDVFAEAMLETSSTRQKRHPLKWAASLGAHVVVLTLLLLLPLYFSQGLDMRRLNATLLVAPLPPSAPPPFPPASVMRAARAVAPKTFTPGKLTAPSFVPKAVPVTADGGPPDEALVALAGGIPGGVAGGIPGGQIGGILGGTLKEVAAPRPVASEGPKRPVRVGGNVKAPQLLSGPAPVYPVLARQSRIQGTVVIEAVIDEHGNVVQVRAISGHPLLIPAAMQAVSQRKYEPTILDGEPTPVALRVEVNFSTN